MQIEILVDLFLQPDLIGNDKLFFGDGLVSADAFLGHEVEEMVFGVEFVVEVLFDVLVSLVL